MAKKKAKKGWNGPYPPGKSKNGEPNGKGDNRPRDRMTVKLREKKIVDLYLKGWSATRISAKLGISTKTVSRYQHRILEKWQAEDGEYAVTALQKRVRMHELAASEAFQAWEVSKRDGQEIITTTTMISCPTCHGSGEDPEDEENDCPNCDGDGRIKEDKITTKIKGKAGDASLLKEYRENVKAAAQLEGLAIPKKVEHTIQGQVEHTHAPKQISDDNQFKDLPPELVLEVMSVMDKVERARKSGNDIIDVNLIEEEKAEVA